MTKTFLTLQQFAAKHPWPPISSLYAYNISRKSNKFKKAFVKVGRRVLICEEDFFQILEKMEAKTARKDRNSDLKEKIRILKNEIQHLKNEKMGDKK